MYGVWRFHGILVTWYGVLYSFEKIFGHECEIDADDLVRQRKEGKGGSGITQLVEDFCRYHVFRKITCER